MSTNDSNDSRSAPGATSIARHPLAPWIAVTVLAMMLVVIVVAGGEKPPSKVAAPTTTAVGTGTTTGATPASGQPGTATTLKKRYWPAEVNGRPPVFGEQLDRPPLELEDVAPGLYVWSDFDGWHVWYARAADGPELHGTITSGGNIEKALPENDGGIDVTLAGPTITFTAGLDGAAVSGVAFNPGFFSDRVRIEVDATIPVFLGSTGDERQAPLDIIKI